MALLTDVNEITRTAMKNLLDTFTGTDGGKRYICFCTLVIRLDKQAKEGDQAATQLLDFIHKTSKLIDVANQP